MRKSILGALSGLGAMLGLTREYIVVQPTGGSLHSHNGGRNRHPRVKPMHRRANAVRRWKR